MRFRPLHGVIAVVLFATAVIVADLALDGRLGAPGYERVTAGPDGEVRVSLAGLGSQQVRFYHFLNPANQEVWFFVGRDAAGRVQVAFNASEVCAKRKRGFRREGEWIVCNQCDKSFHLADVNDGGGGCKPVPLRHQVVDGQVLIAQADVLAGWRPFK
jgi:uncharacterized membrane protein